VSFSASYYFQHKQQLYHLTALTGWHSIMENVFIFCAVGKKSNGVVQVTGPSMLSYCFLVSSGLRDNLHNEFRLTF